MSESIISQAQTERELFSHRLSHALVSAGYDGKSPTKLQREFNARVDSPITIHAARKWLVGESIPTQARIKVLADWLGVQPAYLRFGGAVEQSRVVDRIPAENVRILSELARLAPRDRDTVRKLVSVLANTPSMREAA